VNIFLFEFASSIERMPSKGYLLSKAKNKNEAPF